MSDGTRNQGHERGQAIREELAEVNRRLGYLRIITYLMLLSTIALVAIAGRIFGLF